MTPVAELVLEMALLAVLNLAIIYLAAFVYMLNWSGVLTVMVLSSVLTGSFAHYLLPRLTRSLKSLDPHTAVSEVIGVLAVALVSSLAVLILLSYRFNLPMALGLSLISGLLSTLVRRLLAAV
jgi:phosphatidylglycerophosphatase A